MPPRKKQKELVQTKLNFGISAPSPVALFTVVKTAAPYQTHTQGKDPSPPQSTKPHSSAASTPFQHGPSQAFGGKSCTNEVTDIKSSGNIVSTKDLDAVSRPAPTLSSTSSVTGHRPSAVVGTTYNCTSGHNNPESPLDGDKDVSSNTPSLNLPDKETRKRKASESAMDIDEDDTVPSAPIEIESDSEEDDLLQMPQETRNMHIFKSSSTVFPKTSASQSGTANPKPSLLDQMATPKGTRPMPRILETTNPKAIVGYNAAAKLASGSEAQHGSSTPSGISAHGRTSNRPLDDGSISMTKLDNKMQTPLSQGSSKAVSSQQQQQQQQHSKVLNYSQKRNLDFTAYSKGGTNRILPPSVVGYQPVSNFNTHGASKAPMTTLARVPSVRRSQTTESTGNRSSSPVSSGSQLYNGSSNNSAKYPNHLTRDGMVLSGEQQHVIHQVINEKKNVFFTGSAGTGKSVLLRELIFRLREKYKGGKRESWESTDDAVAVTASTGIAACNIGGCTLHSFAGVGLGLEALPVLQGKARKNQTVARRWQDTKVLIVDEVSMVDSDFMDKLEALARFIRKNEHAPWGGIQVVLTGDFFQLPPVNKTGNVKFCFEGESWARSISLTIQLQEVFRQKDQSFAKMLNEMRLGQLSPVTVERFQTLTRDLGTSDGLRPTELFPLRNQVEEANNRMLNSLQGKVMVYHARDSGVLRDKMEQNCLAPTTLQLKVGAQVMLLRNQAGGAGGLVNGSIGVLTGFVNRPADNEQLGGERKGSLNKSGEELPLVKFTLEGGATREMVVGREEWKIELPNGDVQGSRVQIPLGLAWSLSIHKSQGQTLPKVRVDLGRVFEKGQAYVALSRATTLDGLQVLNFDPRKVMVHPKVTEFYSKLRVYTGPTKY